MWGDPVERARTAGGGAGGDVKRDGFARRRRAWKRGGAPRARGAARLSAGVDSSTLKVRAKEQSMNASSTKK